MESKKLIKYFSLEIEMCHKEYNAPFYKKALEFCGTFNFATKADIAKFLDNAAKTLTKEYGQEFEFAFYGDVYARIYFKNDMIAHFLEGNIKPIYLDIITYI